MLHNSARPRRHRIPLAGATALSTCIVSLAASSQETSTPPGEQPAESAPNLPDLTVIQEQVAELRGLPFKRDVPAEKQSIDDFREYLLADLEKYYPKETFGNVMDGLLRLGLMKQKVELDEAFVNALLTQAGAYYDPETGKFYYLMTDMPEMMLRVFAAHELVHALQDQHFGLGERMKEFEKELVETGPLTVRNDDAIHALRFLAEGEATYVMNLYSYGEEGGNKATDMIAVMDLEQIIIMSKKLAEQGQFPRDIAEAFEATDEIPNYILVPLYAAYMNGAVFVLRLREAGTWEAVADAWRHLPASTELTLHPEKYLDEMRDMPTTIPLPAFEHLAEQGWKPIDSATHGELLLQLLLKENGIEQEVSKKAATGWDGDVYRAWRHEDGDVMIVLATTWDTPKHAAEFRDAYQAALKEKYPDLDDSITNPDDENVYRFNCGESLGAGSLVLRGTEVFSIEGGSLELTASMMTELLAQPIERVRRVSVVGDDQPALDLPGMTFTPDPGWIEEEPPTETRVAQFLFPAAEGVEVETRFVIYRFPTPAGTVEDNIERWKGQFQKGSRWFQHNFEVRDFQVNLLDINGTYIAETAPGSGEFMNEADWRMIACIVHTNEGPYYFKLLGPRATVDTWAESFHKALKSLR